MTSETEVTLRAFIESVWFRGLARGAAILGSLLITGFIGTWAWMTWGVIGPDLTLAKANIASVATVLESRTADSEAFQSEVRGAVKVITEDVAALSTDVFSVRVDIGVIKRLVIELRDQGKAAALPLPSDPLPRPSTVAAASPIGRSPLLQ